MAAVCYYKSGRELDRAGQIHNFFAYQELSRVSGKPALVDDKEAILISVVNHLRCESIRFYRMGEPSNWRRGATPRDGCHGSRLGSKVRPAVGRGL